MIMRPPPARVRGKQEDNVCEEETVPPQMIPSWARAPRLIEFELVILKDGHQIDSSFVDKAVSVIGREAGCDYVMEHPSISRRHAAIISDGVDGVYAVDLNSTYGTTVDGVRLTEMTRLSENKTLRFGQSSRVFKLRRLANQTGQSELTAANLPESFGSKKRSRTDADEARVRLAERRKQREAEIAAITREMLETEPSWQVPEVVEEKQEEEVVALADAEPLSPGLVAEEDSSVLAKRWGFPISHEIRLGSPSRKTVSCLAVDPGGARVIVGSLDNRLRLYDFGGMDKEHRPFREIEPDDGHAVVAVSFSPSGDRFLCCTGSAQPQILTRDGKMLLKFNRGDPYVTDMTRTTGHVTSVTGGEWQPGEKMRCATSSVDGSVRLWDLCGRTGLRDYLFCEATIRCKDKAARKTAATTMAFSPDGKLVAAGCADGSVQYWQIRGRAHSYIRPDGCTRQAHAASTDASGSVLSCVKFSPDGRLLASRADDGCLKLWDIRMFSKQIPLASFTDLPAHHATANLDWSPDGAVVCAGDDDGRIRFFAAAGQGHELFKVAGGYSPLLSLHVTGVSDSDRKRRPTSVPVVLWQPRIRHIFCGTSDGLTRALYDPDLSVKGALLSAKRDHTRRNVDAVLTADPRLVGDGAIVNPNALPMFRNDDALRSRGRYAKTRNDPKASKMPDKPLEQGQQGRNTGARSTFCQFYVERHLPQSIREQDPREELLKYANHPPIFKTDTTFYTDGKGNRILGDKTLEQEEDHYIDEQKKLLSNQFSGSHTGHKAERSSTRSGPQRPP